MFQSLATRFNLKMGDKEKEDQAKLFKKPRDKTLRRSISMPLDYKDPALYGGRVERPFWKKRGALTTDMITVVHTGIDPLQAYSAAAGVHETEHLPSSTAATNSGESPPKTVHWKDPTGNLSSQSLLSPGFVSYRLLDPQPKLKSPPGFLDDDPFRKHSIELAPVPATAAVPVSPKKKKAQSLRNFPLGSREALPSDDLIPESMVPMDRLNKLSQAGKNRARAGSSAATANVMPDSLSSGEGASITGQHNSVANLDNIRHDPPFRAGHTRSESTPSTGSAISRPRAHVKAAPLDPNGVEHGTTHRSHGDAHASTDSLPTQISLIKAKMGSESEQRPTLASSIRSSSRDKVVNVSPRRPRRNSQVSNISLPTHESMTQSDAWSEFEQISVVPMSSYRSRSPSRERMIHESPRRVRGNTQTSTDTVPIQMPPLRLHKEPQTSADTLPKQTSSLKSHTRSASEQTPAPDSSNRTASRNGMAQETTSHARSDSQASTEPLKKSDTRSVNEKLPALAHSNHSTLRKEVVRGNHHRSSGDTQGSAESLPAKSVRSSSPQPLIPSKPSDSHNEVACESSRSTRTASPDPVPLQTSAAKSHTRSASEQLPSDRPTTAKRPQTPSSNLNPSTGTRRTRAQSSGSPPIKTYDYTKPTAPLQIPKRKNAVLPAEVQIVEPQPAKAEVVDPAGANLRRRNTHERKESASRPLAQLFPEGINIRPDIAKDDRIRSTTSYHHMDEADVGLLKSTEPPAAVPPTTSATPKVDVAPQAVDIQKAVAAPKAVSAPKVAVPKATVEPKATVPSKAAAPKATAPPKAPSKDAASQAAAKPTTAAPPKVPVAPKAATLEPAVPAKSIPTPKVVAASKAAGTPTAIPKEVGGAHPSDKVQQQKIAGKPRSSHPTKTTFRADTEEYKVRVTIVRKPSPAHSNEPKPDTPSSKSHKPSTGKVTTGTTDVKMRITK